MSSLSEAIKEAYATAPADVRIINTLEISHESITDSIFLAQSDKHLELTLETGETKVFKACPFNFTMPQVGDNGVQELNITVDNIDRQITEFIQVAKDFLSPVEIRFRPYLANDPSVPQLVPPLVLFIKDVSITVTEVSIRATMGDLINKKFPSEKYTRERFPSLGS